MRSIFEYTDYREYLSDYYRYRKSEKSTYSHRMIEQRIGISAGYFSRIISGSKTMSDRLIQKFTAYLKLKKREADYFEDMVKFTQADSTEIKTHYYERMLRHMQPKAGIIAKQQYQFFRETHNTALHALIGLRSIPVTMNPARIGNMLNPPVSVMKIKHSLKLLEQLGLIRINDDDHFEVTERMLTTGHVPRNITVRNYILDTLSATRGIIATLPEKERDIAIMTVSISRNAYDEITNLFKDIRDRINTIVQNDRDMTKVYQIGMYAVPVSKDITEGELE